MCRSDSAYAVAGVDSFDVYVPCPPVCVSRGVLGQESCRLRDVCSISANLRHSRTPRYRICIVTSIGIGIGIGVGIDIGVVTGVEHWYKY